MSFENNTKQNFKQIYKYLTLENKILLFFDNRKYDIMYSMNFNLNKFHFIDDEHYIEEMKIDYENYLFYTENKFSFENDELDWNYRYKKYNYLNFTDTDKRIPDKFKPFFYRAKNTGFIDPKLPTSISMKKDIINAVFSFEKEFYHPIKNNNETKVIYMCEFAKPDSNFSFMSKDKIKSAYEHIINNNITKL